MIVYKAAKYQATSRITSNWPTTSKQQSAMHHKLLLPSKIASTSSTMTNKENPQALQSTKSTLSGAIAELGGDVFQCGNRAGDDFASTKELIADHVGRLHGKRMRILALQMKENPPAPPEVPKTTPPKKTEPIPAEWRT